MSANETVEVQAATGKEKSTFAKSLISTRQAAQMLGVSLRTIQLWVDSGVLTAWKTAGGHRRVMVESVEQLKLQGIVRPSADARLLRSAAANQEVFLGRTPIMDMAGGLVGMAFPYRLGNVDFRAPAAETESALSRVLSVAFDGLGLGRSVGKSACFISANAAVGNDDLLRSLPREGVVLEFSDLDGSDRDVVARVKQLKKAGFGIALDAFVSNPADKALVELADYVKIDVGALSDESVAEILGKLDGKPAIACGVDDGETLEKCREAGFSHVQGYAFLQGSPSSTATDGLLKILSKVIQDVPSADIERLFRNEPDLSAAFVNLCNSVAAGTHRKVEGLSQGLALLGRAQAGKWLLLLPYAGGSQALLQLAATRGAIMEQLSLILGNRRGGEAHRAYMAGVLSAVGSAYGMPMDAVLAKMKVPDEIAVALLKREGAYGPMLAMAERLEDMDYEQALTLFNRYRVNVPRLMEIQSQALHFAAGLSETLYP